MLYKFFKFFTDNTHCHRPCVRVDTNLVVAAKCEWVSVTLAGTSAGRCILLIPRERYNTVPLRPPCQFRLPRPPTTKHHCLAPASTDTSSRSLQICENTSAPCSLEISLEASLNNVLLSSQTSRGSTFNSDYFIDTNTIIQPKLKYIEYIQR